jgi:hypothetical protein
MHSATPKEAYWILLRLKILASQNLSWACFLLVMPFGHMAGHLQAPGLSSLAHLLALALVAVQKLFQEWTPFEIPAPVQTL